MPITIHKRLLLISMRELRRIASKPMYVFCMLVAPIFCFIFFTTLMSKGLPNDLPAGVVDLDNTSTTRNIIRNLDAFQNTQIIEHFSSFNEAREAMQKGEIYSFYYIPKGTTEEAISGRQPTVSFYINYSYLIAGSLLYKDQRTMSELASGAVGRSTLLAKGATMDQAMAYLQPIIIDTHALNNPWLNYSVYLCNTLFPGILMLLIFLTTSYALGVEIKDKTSRQLLKMGNNSIVTALIGKLLPHTIIFFVVAVFYNVYLYGFQHFPCNSGIFPMLLAGLLLVLSSQALGIFFFGLFGSMRLAMSCASLWGVISFSISGFTFPVMAMHPTLQALSNLFPLRNYFLLYVNLALNGYPLIYAWHSVVILLLFMILPFFVLKKLQNEMLHYEYIP
ncbi:ABC transporter permease [uncultured Bacteroides sp.]|uniref:ABC transporter permease n=1 Tax=uncultured Bacteroides sp. TaxID=162156 RepID=UPI00263703CD|nr:ABC transporter permease [uncultured Bacteroides sp.]